MEINRDRDLVLRFDEVKELLIAILKNTTASSEAITTTVESLLETSVNSITGSIVSSQNVQDNTLEDRINENSQNRYAVISETLSLLGDVVVQVKTNANTILGLLGTSLTSDSINTKLDTIITKLDQIITAL